MRYPYSITANELAQANYCSLQLSKSTSHSGIVKKTALCIATCKERRRRRTYSHPQLRNKTYIVRILNSWTNIVVEYKGSQRSEQYSQHCIYHINARTGHLQD